MIHDVQHPGLPTSSLTGTCGHLRVATERYEQMRNWWSWGDLNPRPQAFFGQFYMCSRLI